MPIEEEKLAQIDAAVQNSLKQFIKYVTQFSWKGREREAISLYAFGFLQKQFQSGAVLQDPTQIGIEVAVPSVEWLNPKGRVCKDLVLWANPKMTCWDENWQATHYPLAIMEWKAYRHIHKSAKVSDNDVKWLSEYSTLYPTVGYAVALDLAHRKFNLSATRVLNGQLTIDWLRF
jgi:hypothetical protein